VTDHLDMLDDLIARARKAGADAADALAVGSTALSVAHRLGKAEGVERAESTDLGLRVFLGKRQAVASTTDFSAAGLSRTVEQAINMAKVAPEDPWCGLADEKDLACDFPDLDIAGSGEPDPLALTALAAEAEDAARAVPGVTNSEGAEAGWSRSDVALATSAGFRGAYASGHYGLSVSVLAGTGTGMETDHAFSAAVHMEDLKAAAEVGHDAGTRAVRRLNPRKLSTRRVPVVFENRLSGRLLRALAGGISGPSIARGTSFLKDALDKEIFAPDITVIDDPHRRRGLRSKPFDGEGVANARRAIIDRGRLTTWLLDSTSGRQLGLASTGHAVRGTSAPPSPSPTNFYMEPGKLSRDDLIKDIADGLFVTDLMGMGVNGVTGDYSQGAAGFWIENGTIAYPVSEVTIASNLKDMFRAMAAASDLEFRSGTDAPTLRIEGMTVAGK